MFETIAANHVDFLVVDPTFFTNKLNSDFGETHGTSMGSPTISITKIQDTLLDGKYLDRTVFDNITGTECISRYTAAFITSGSGFGVPTAGYRKLNGMNANFSFLEQDMGSGDLYIQGWENREYDCKFRSTGNFRLLYHECTNLPQTA